MKRIVNLTFLLLSLQLAYAQQTFNASIQHDGLEREYIMYIPASYDGSEAVPLILNFHGYTSNSLEQLVYGDFRSIADTANFLVVHPMGTEDNTGTTHWNVGWGGSTVDDVGFTNALLDSLAANYNINQERIYSTGMSNGGFMSYQLACELSERIAAIASVTGTMNAGSFAACNPTHPMPVMEIHGTNDATVPYDGANWIEGSEDVVAFWAEFNNADAAPSITQVPDTDPNDGSTGERWVYANGDNGSTVELFKVIDGGHTWPGASFLIPGLVTNQDINASAEIWRFFSQYDINGLNPVTSTEQLTIDEQVRIFPNPTKGQLMLQTGTMDAQPYQFMTATGETLWSGRTTGANQPLDLSGLPRGVYLLRVGDQVRKVIKQ